MRADPLTHCCALYRQSQSRAGDSQQSEALGVRDAVAREVRKLQEAHAEGTGPVVDRQTIISLIRRVRPGLLWSTFCDLAFVPVIDTSLRPSCQAQFLNVLANTVALEA